MADAAPVAGLIPLQTERLNLRRKARRQGTRVISRNGTTTMKDHAGAGATTAGHPPGRDVGGPVLLHGITNQVISPRRKEKSRERSRMIRRRDDPVVDDVPDTGKRCCCSFSLVSFPFLFFFFSFFFFFWRRFSPLFSIYRMFNLLVVS